MTAAPAVPGAPSAATVAAGLLRTRDPGTKSSAAATPHTATPDAADSGTATSGTANSGPASPGTANSETAPPDTVTPTASASAPADAAEEAATSHQTPARAGDEDTTAPEAQAAEGTTGSSAESAGEPPSAQPADASATELVAVVRGVPRYHEPDCVLIRFMPDSDVQRTTVPQAKADGCTPCAACQPAG
jgi:hypothetical protein